MTKRYNLVEYDFPKRFEILMPNGRVIALWHYTETDYETRLAEARALVHAGNVLEAAVEANSSSVAPDKREEQAKYLSAYIQEELYRDPNSAVTSEMLVNALDAYAGSLTKGALKK